MPRSAEDLPFNEFVALLPRGILTEDEVVSWIRAQGGLGVSERIELNNALAERPGGVTEPILTAVRALDGPPPVTD